MKKSEIYHRAQLAVLEASILPDAKLEILRELLSEEQLHRHIEQAREKQEAQNEEV